jgi:hypothetical protein
MAAMIETLGADMTLKDEGTQKTTLRGEEAALRKLSTTFTAASCNMFFDQLADYYEREFTAAYAMIPPTEETAASQEQLGIFVEAIRNMTMPGDMVINYYINKDQLISKIEMQETDYTVEEGTMTVGFAADLLGTKNILDEIDANLTVSMDGETVGINIKRTATNENNVVNDRVIAVLSAEGAEVGSLDYDFEWEKDADADRNMSLSISASSVGLPSMSLLSIEGNLNDYEGETSLTNGVLTFGVGDILSLSVNGAIREILPEEVSFDEADSVPFTDLTLMELLGGLMPFLQ